ncbi:MAG: hypothetical protein IIB13_06500 [Chloroflexi bacterium]|nr:hypothetical protein [Chloroflexota bacterium]
MKYARIIRILCLAIILSVMVFTVPVAAQTRFITIGPAEGNIGTTITIVGEGFTKSSESTDRYAIIYFSSQEASTLHDIDTKVTAYKIVDSLVYLDLQGEFTTTVEVPTKLDDGADTEDVTVGTYYIYVCYYNLTSPPTIATKIRSAAEFTVTGGEITLDFTEDPVATEVEITGVDFVSNASLTVFYDDEEINIQSGDDDTDSNGEFVSSILIPESTAGDHTVKVTVSGSEAEAVFTVEPEIILSPTSGEAATTVSVSGTGFGRRSDLVIYFNGAGLKTLTTDSAGSFGANFDVPELDVGIYDVEAEDDDNNLDTSKFTITVPPPPTPSEPTPSEPATPDSTKTQINVETPGGAIGGTIAFSGSGFDEGDIIVKYDGEEVYTTTASASGLFVALFPAPVSKAGTHTITVSDGTNSEEFIFTVESQAPPVPLPLLPEMGVEVVWPLTFDWKEVIDASQPVTYTLQVATSDDFAAASVILEKAELTASQYALTQVEEAKLSGQETPYYWRIRATDGASNESDWTGAGQFQVPQPFSLPSWAIYTLLGLGGLVLFAVGYYLGRRTAYY